MKFITEAQFLNIFDAVSVPYSQFLRQAKVRVGKNIHALKDYAQNKQIPSDDIKLLYENIKNRNEYLSRFYTMSLRIQPEKQQLNLLEPMKSRHLNNNENVNAKNLIRNMHYKNILQTTKSGFENNPTYFDMLTDLYIHHIIDYKILTPSALFYMRNGRLGSVFSSFYFRASIMNPYLVYSLNKSVLKGTRVFTPTLGWTSYCHGFLQCPDVVEYVGTDVIPDVCKKTQQFAKEYYPDKTIDIYCSPSEKLATNAAFLAKYREHFDTVFFSPPYYKLEIYAGASQSTQMYKTYEEWLAKYWEKTIQLCHAVLQKGGKMCYILSGYGSENTSEQYDLITDMNRISRQYFVLKEIQPMFNKDVHVTKHKETAEKIILFIKK